MRLELNLTLLGIGMGVMDIDGLVLPLLYRKSGTDGVCGCLAVCLSVRADDGHGQ